MTQTILCFCWARSRAAANPRPAAIDVVSRRIKYPVQRDREFDDAEAGAEVAPGNRNGINKLGAQFIGRLSKLAFIQTPQIARKHDLIEQGGSHQTLIFAHLAFWA